MFVDKDAHQRETITKLRQEYQKNFGILVSVTKWPIWLVLINFQLNTYFPSHFAFLTLNHLALLNDQLLKKMFIKRAWTRRFFSQNYRLK